LLSADQIVQLIMKLGEVVLKFFEAVLKVLTMG